uniref:Uncharacterized protein n=1 Tax=Chrysoporthe deuterocubensis TaxID=764597 RepID=A0A191MWY3_9PEZI|nr:hypothetical protein [Chrysoporthe deuterocubensis]AMX22191.1 hypothetical protein [Chrysoporthe deuterocubensis]
MNQMKNLNNKKLFMVGLFIVLILLILICYCICGICDNVDILENSVNILENNDSSTVISNNKDILLGDKVVANSKTHCKWLDLFTDKSSFEVKSYFIKNDIIQKKVPLYSSDEKVRNYKIIFYCERYRSSLLLEDILGIVSTLL